MDGEVYLQGGGPTDQPGDQHCEPLPIASIASIAWWWHYDPARKSA
jgi:hypothetical protein